MSLRRSFVHLYLVVGTIQDDLITQSSDLENSVRNKIFAEKFGKKRTIDLNSSTPSSIATMAQAEKTLKEIFLARPTLSTNSFTSQSPLTASIEPVVLFSILDHALRRNANQKRVIGTMLGVRSDDGTEIEIRNCFAVPHNESSEQVSSFSRDFL